MTSPIERDFAVHEYKSFLLRKGRSANTVNSILAALDNFYLYIGMGSGKD